MSLPHIHARMIRQAAGLFAPSVPPSFPTRMSAACNRYTSPFLRQWTRGAGDEDNGGFEKMPAEPRQIFSARGREETQERLQFALERERGATKQKQLVSLIAPTYKLRANL